MYRSGLTMSSKVLKLSMAIGSAPLSAPFQPYFNESRPSTGLFWTATLYMGGLVSVPGVVPVPRFLGWTRGSALDCFFLARSE
jgi:hypothetical protein